MAQAEELLPKVEDVKSEQMSDLVDQEMQQTKDAIEKAVQKLTEILAKCREKLTGIQLEVNEKILDSCNALMKALHLLIHRSQKLQKEIVSQGRETDSQKEFYKRHHRWAEGLLSAARAVGSGANVLLETAEKVIKGEGKFEELVVCSQEIADSTTQLVVVSKVKADKNSKNLTELSKASKGANQATDQLVASSKSGAQMIKDLADYFSKLTLHQTNTQEMEPQVRMFGLESDLVKDRKKLTQLQKTDHQIARESEVWELERQHRLTQSSVTDLEKFIVGHHLKLGDVITSSESKSFSPITKLNIHYIVAAVIINEENKVLLMQEAKLLCRGQWYLPAGRMEQGESLVEGVKREVLEETGLKFEPNTIVCVEAQGTLWYRFTFTGIVTGGALKTPTQMDEESIQAGWFPIEVVTQPTKNVPLRGKDIVPLVNETIKFRDLATDARHDLNLPLLIPHRNVVLRILFICKTSGKDNYFCLKKVKRKSGEFDLPAIAINPRESSLHVTVIRLVQELFVRCVPEIHGLISVEHMAKGNPSKRHEGICFNLLCSTAKPIGELPVVKTEEYTWIPMKQNRTELICLKTSLQTLGTVPFII